MLTIRTPLLGLLALTTLTALGQAQAAEWQLDPSHMRVGFSVEHLGFSTVHGQFDQVSGQIRYDPAKPKATTVSARIDTRSINTGWAKRDEHLRTADFFNAENFPAMTFKSTSIQWQGKTRAKLKGELTLLGVTKPVVMDVQIKKHAASPITKLDTIGFHATTTVKRSDFGMKTYVPMITDAVPVVIDAELIPASPDAPAGQ